MTGLCGEAELGVERVNQVVVSTSGTDDPLADDTVAAHFPPDQLADHAAEQIRMKDEVATDDDLALDPHGLGVADDRLQFLQPLPDVSGLRRRLALLLGLRLRFLGDLDLDRPMAERDFKLHYNAGEGSTIHLESVVG